MPKPKIDTIPTCEECGKPPPLNDNPGVDVCQVVIRSTEPRHVRIARRSWHTEYDMIHKTLCGDCGVKYNTKKIGTTLGKLRQLSQIRKGKS